MPRMARLVIPDVPHHITQRGNRRQDVFFTPADYAAYVAMLKRACETNGVRCLAWCLMPNHVHLILTPPTAHSLQLAVSDLHRRYARQINRAHDWTGYLFQGRFASYPMDSAHLLNAVRYVENNPVAAGLVACAEDWRWSSARAHIVGKVDGVTDLGALEGAHGNWRGMLRDGWQASEQSDAIAKAIETSLNTGRPLGPRSFIERLEQLTGRSLTKTKPGPRRR
ncbi:MAG: transposase [Sphingopyxis sp.]|nr:transposase [Sphingopyxis sp.]